MDTQTATPTGAETQTEVVSAERAAADKGDVSAFLEADRSRREGKPLERVTRAKAAPAEPGASGRSEEKPAAATVDKAATAKGPTAADRDADERLTTRVREAVETSTAELRRQNRELQERLDAISRGGAEPKPGSGAAATETTDKPAASGRLTKAEIARYQAMPGAPKLDDVDPKTGEHLYDSTHEHAIAMAEFIRETRQKDEAMSRRQADDHVARSRQEAERVQVFGGKVDEWKKANADLLVDRTYRTADGQTVTVKAIPLSEDMNRIHGFAQLNATNAARQKAGLQPLPPTVDHVIGELIYRADDPGEVAWYLSQKPEELAKLRTGRDPDHVARIFGGIEERASKFRETRKPAPAAGAAGAEVKTKTPTEVRREAEAVVDRSVSSVKPAETNLGKGGGITDPIEAAIAKGDFGAFQELDRQARIEKMRGGRR